MELGVLFAEVQSVSGSSFGAGEATGLRGMDFLLMGWDFYFLKIKINI